MKYSLSWLNEWVPVTLDTPTLCEKLTQAGFEVEAVHELGENLELIVTGKITQISKHPDADKLQITQIDIGKPEPIQIVTGAQNIHVDAIVPVSLPGSTLANGTKIKSAPLRGVDSHGMLCSQTELGLAEVSQGIWLLPTGTPIGIDFIEFAKIKDTIIEINILPNRSDCLSIQGLAREISAITSSPLQIPTITGLSHYPKSAITLKNDVPDQCPRYIGTSLTFNNQATTPLWMQIRLTNCGISSINLPVDITNYVMLELGQPMHGFDHSYVTNALVIRHSDKGETLKTLDKNTTALPENTLVIANDKVALAIAGIIGGEDSGITNSTQRVFLESAHFEAISTRKTKSKLNITTESALRFSKHTDPTLPPIAMSRAIDLFEKLADGKVESLLDFTSDNSDIFEPAIITFESKKINQLLGSQWSENEMETILNSLQISTKNGKATLPSWRKNDITEWPCLAEEISRIKGMDSIPTTLPKQSISVENPTKEVSILSTITSQLTELGFYQLSTLPMISSSDLTHLAVDPTLCYEVQNPITVEQSIMRPSLLPGILKVLQHNQNHFAPLQNCFEIGKVFSKDPNQASEMMTLTLIMTQSYFQDSYTHNEKLSNTLRFADLKGISELILEKMRLPLLQFVANNDPNLHPIQSAEITVTHKSVGQLGFLHPKIAKKYDIDQPLGIVTLNISKLVETPTKRAKSSPYSRQPITRRDIAILAPQTLSHEDILKFLNKNKSKFVKDIQLFDLFEDENKLGKGQKSLAYSIFYQGESAPILETDIATHHQKLCDALINGLPVQLR